MTIPGIGEITAIGIMSEVVDIAYFPSAPQLAKWAGLTPRVKQSGLKKKHVTGRIYKAGNRFLRRHLTSAVKSMNMIAPENKLCNILKIRNKSEPFWKDGCAVARRLIVIIWHMLVNKEAWDNTRDNDDSNPEFLEKLKESIQRKIQLLERKFIHVEKKLHQINESFDIS